MAAFKKVSVCGKQQLYSAASAHAISRMNLVYKSETEGAVIWQ